MNLIRPEWPVPENVGACMTTRQGGVSLPPWDSLNLGDHAGDDAASVAENRRRLCENLGLHAHDLGWLRQVHGTRVVKVPHDSDEPPQADAAWTDQPGKACVVLTADCLPVLFCDREGTRVAAAHAGWRGLAEGVLEATVAQFPDPASVMAWLGVAIGPEHFEVGADVHDAFADYPEHFRPHPNHAGKYLADLYGLARSRLREAGVQSIHGGTGCTFAQSETFFSYRRDGTTGRMASLIYLR